MYLFISIVLPCIGKKLEFIFETSWDTLTFIILSINKNCWDFFDPLVLTLIRHDSVIRNILEGKDILNVILFSVINRWRYMEQLFYYRLKYCIFNLRMWRRRPLWYLMYFPCSIWARVFVRSIASPQTLDECSSRNPTSDHVLLTLLLLNFKSKSRTEDSL